MQQATDFREESRVLAAVLEPLAEVDFFAVTQFKGWSIDDMLGHLHIFNHAAALALKDGDLFHAFFADMSKIMQGGGSMIDAQRPWVDGLKGRALFEAWRVLSEDVADAFSVADPKARLAWAGPSMSARSSITARQMETWAHGHEVFDLLGVSRVETDRVKNIVVLGVNTFCWAYHVRGLDVPPQMPFLELTAPSGDVWTFGAESDDRVVGSAVGFAQAVTQTRHWTDTDLRALGDGARDWMEIAQCFAGGVAPPPAAGTRFRGDTA
jgi:uncharacterized protein (TIGR03084 family)